MIWPEPVVDGYKIHAVYQAGPQVLAADDDVPELPEEFHEVIKWGAMMKLAGLDSSPVRHEWAMGEYRRRYRALRRHETAPYELAGSIERSGGRQSRFRGGTGLYQ